MKQNLQIDIELKKNPYPGTFVVIEGNEGAGKTTQVAAVSKMLSQKHKVHATKQPSDGPIGKLIRESLSEKITIPRVAFQYLFSADREAQQEEIISHLKKGEIMILDRYVWSALAYGTLDHGFENLEKTGNILAVSLSILSMYHQFLMPDLTIYLDVTPETSIKRLTKAGKMGEEVYETRENIEKIKQCYEWIIKKFPDEFLVLKGDRPEDEITKKIISHIEPLIKK